MKKILIPALMITLFLSVAKAFDWPVLDISEEKISSYFGQFRKGTINHALIFKNTDEVFSTDKGRITCLIEEHDDDGQWFESTLGNAAIIVYEDNLQGVYGNLDSESVSENLKEITYIEANTKMGKTGNSAWAEDEGVLEFQISDTGAKTYINPLILMPRMHHEKRLSLSDILMIDRHGKTFEPLTQKNLPAGYYTIYRKTQDLPVPYTTSVIVNGSIQETVSYNTFFQDDNRITVKGNGNYSTSDIYGNPSHQMIGNILLPHGKNTMTMIVTDLLGNETVLIYNLTAF